MASLLHEILAVERLLYLYSSVTSDVTIDVVNLNDYTLEGDLIQPSQHKFRLKITHPQAETHEFYTMNADSFYLWFATFDRLSSKRTTPKTIVQEKIQQQNQLSMKREAKKSIKARIVYSIKERKRNRQSAFLAKAVFFEKFQGKDHLKPRLFCTNRNNVPFSGCIPLTLLAFFFPLLTYSANFVY